MSNLPQKTEYVAQAYANAETVGTVGEETFFVPFMIVGEKALVRVVHRKNNVCHATVEEILQPAKTRQQPPCKAFGKCGGCSLMHMKYGEQLVFKQNKVVNNLKKIGGLDVPVQKCVASPKILGYRNKLSLPVRGSVGRCKMGMFRLGTHTVVDCDDCLLGGSWAQKTAKLFRDFINKNKIAPYNEKTFGGVVRHLVARCVDDQLLVTVVVNKPGINWQPFLKILQNNFQRVGLFENVNTAKNNVIMGEDTRHVGGISCIKGTHLGVKFQLHPDSFFQVNDGIKNLIYAKVKELLDVAQTQVLVDCFSGIGILTNVLASEKYQTFGVEIVPTAVKDANQLAQLNNSPNVTNICGDATKTLREICANNQGKVLSLVVDPPRKGLGAEFCQTVLNAEFNNVVYVSCDSATLARDLKMLKEKYDVCYVQPFDMFPNTAEVETLVHLRRK